MLLITLGFVGWARPTASAGVGPCPPYKITHPLLTPCNFNFNPASDRAGNGQVYLLARPEEIAPLGVNKYQGFALYLVNGSKQRMTFDASDSRVSIVREAKDDAGVWREIEYLPSSWCGNSRHHVLIDPAQGWRFVAPKYAGPLKTTMRFKLTTRAVAARPGATPTATVIYSNEFEGTVHPEQFDAKQGHRPTDIMDPYLE